jgi:hypothetical protein
MDLQTKVLEPGVAILCILQSRDDRKTGQITWLSNKQTWETDWIIKPWVNLACCFLRRSPIGIQDRFVWKQHLLVAKKILNWVPRLCTSICQFLRRSSIGFQDYVPAASTSCWNDPQLGYETVPVAFTSCWKDPQLITRLYQQHQPVTEKILNWVTRLWKSSIQQLLKRYSIGFQDCVLGGTADMMDVARYREITITTTSDKNTHYHSPSSCLLLQKCMCVKTQQKNRPVQSIKGLYTNPPLLIVSGQCICVYKYIQI